MSLSKLTLLASVASAFVAQPPWQQLPLPSNHGSGNVQCDLPPVIDPSSDGLPSSSEMFSSKAARETQVKRHQAIVRVDSICYDDLGDFDSDKRWKPFGKLHSVLAKTYPRVHKHAKLEKINRYGLVYTIAGSDSSLKPVLLAAHQDVVPVADESTWTHPPFSGYYDGEWLWGRGASDDKNSLTGIMSAVETLLGNSEWKPRRTLILAFGFDEECSGYRGAGTIGPHLTSRYGDDSLAIILDEGGLGMPKIGNVQYALPGVMEKGHVDVWLELHVVGGHSSIPFPHTGIGIMSEIITLLEANPYEAKLTKENPVYGHLMCQARYSPDADPELTRLIKNDDLDAVTKLLIKKDVGSHYMIQTSQAVDMISGGQKINAMPELTKAGVNYRVAGHDSLQLVQNNVAKFAKQVARKYGIKVDAYTGDEAYAAYVEKHEGDEDDDDFSAKYDVDYKGTLILSARESTQIAPVSPTTGSVWDVFSGTIQYTFAFDDGTVVPAGEGMTGNTDTRHYLSKSPILTNERRNEQNANSLDLSRNVYRFSPVLGRGHENIHTIDEKVHMDDHMLMLKFYYDFIRNFDAADL